MRRTAKDGLVHFSIFTFVYILVYIFEYLKHKKVTDGKVAYSGKIFGLSLSS